MKIHLAAVCGTAMASLAGLLRERGDRVTGSDQDVYPPMSTQLAAMGVEILSPYAEGNVPEDSDLVVIGNALSRGNPEVEVVLDRRQEFTSLPAVVGQEFIRGRRSFVVAGTHGKTTTTSLLAFLLDRCGASPSFLVGGVPLDFDRSFRIGAGRDFVIEGDEYDCAFFDKRPKFVHYRPDVAIIGNVEFDHADIYPDLAAVQTAFLRLVNLVPRSGLIIAGAESGALTSVLEQAHSRVATFGLSGDLDWLGRDVVAEGRGCRFRIERRGEDLGEWRVAQGGHHSVRNALAALAAGSEAGLGIEAMRQVLPLFRGVRRRQELRGRERGVEVIDDFAHHPTAVRETLRALRGVSDGGRLVAVFEPRSYTSRTRTFQRDFGEALALADHAVIARAHLPEKVPAAQRLSEEDVVRAVVEAKGEAVFIPDVGSIVEHVASWAVEGDRVVILSNGGFGGIHERLLARLARP